MAGGPRHRRVTSFQLTASAHLTKTVLPTALDGPGTEASQGSLLVRFAEILSSIGTVWTFGLMLLVVADVIGRDVFRLPITGVAEIAAHSIVGIVFLQLGAAVAAGRMTSADFLIDNLKGGRPGLARGLEVVFALLGAGTMALIAYASWPAFVQAFRADEYFGVQGIFTIPTWPFRSLIVLGAGLSAVMYLRAALKLVNRTARR
jgi:TRAP-type C4-dicarboxylate transport system permease small subunit